MSFCHEATTEADDGQTVELVEPMLPPPKRRRDNRGRPWASNRGCFEGILWILRTGAAWRFLPDEFPSPSTCWQRLQQWEEEGVWLNAWCTLLGAPDEEGLLKWDETFLDGSFAPAKKGPCRRENQAGQGDEVDGTGRRSESSAGSSAGKCHSARSYACGSHAPTSLGTATQRPSATKAGKGNCRHRLRFGPVAPTTEETRHRVDRALPGEQSAPALRRWAQLATLQAALDRRTNQRLAGSVPTIAGAS
jgi:transposase